MRSNGIQVLDRALSILEVISKTPAEPRGPAAIAGEVGINAATCSRILKSLMNRGYVEQDGPKSGYRLGPMAFALTASGSYRKDLVYRAEGLMTVLAAETGETVVLAVLRQGRRMVLHEVESTRAVRVSDEIRQLPNPLSTATGRLLLAYLEQETRARVLEAFPLSLGAWPDIDTSAELEVALASIRNEGSYIRTDGEVAGLAYPVMERGTVIAALGLYMPAYRFCGEHRQQALRLLRDASRAASDGAATV